MENGSSQGRNQALTGLYVPSSLGGGVLPDCRRGWYCLIVDEGESEREGDSVREGEGESEREEEGESEREEEGESEREGEGESERAGCCLIVDEVGDCHVRVANRLDLMCVIDLGLVGRGAARAEDVQGTPTQESYITKYTGIRRDCWASPIVST